MRDMRHIRDMKNMNGEMLLHWTICTSMDSKIDISMETAKYSIKSTMRTYPPMDRTDSRDAIASKK